MKAQYLYAAFHRDHRTMIIPSIHNFPEGVKFNLLIRCKLSLDEIESQWLIKRIRVEVPKGMK